MMPFEVKGYNKYGASMGRGSDFDGLRGKVHLRHVRLDLGGYDKGGAYWGLGQPLWCAWNDEAEVFFRADSRGVAQKYLLAKSPEVRFYR